MAPPGFCGRHPNVYIYIPNLIGYVRIVFTLYAFSVAFSRPLHCVVAYFLAFVCDELDGRAARAFGQASTLGAVLDMVTDRVSTTGLLALLVALHPAHCLIFLALLQLDIFSHWFQMYAAQLAGAASHKDVASRSWLVRTYYSNRIFMGFCCVCCEVCYLALYLLHWPDWRDALPVAVPLPALPARAIAAVPALRSLADALERGGVSGAGGGAAVPALVLVVLAALPGVLIKQLCNVVQLRNAARGLVLHDVKRMQ